jgi:hypothetical protein
VKVRKGGGNGLCCRLVSLLDKLAWYGELMDQYVVGVLAKSYPTY